MRDLKDLLTRVKQEHLDRLGSIRRELKMLPPGRLEVLQQHGACVIDYDIVEAVGPVHDCIFTVNVRCNGEVLGSGRGNSKKSAQQRAAKNALERMK